MLVVSTKASTCFKAITNYDHMSKLLQMAWRAGTISIGEAQKYIILVAL